MSDKKKPADPNVPLPDPDLVQQRVESALQRMREKRGLYIGLALFVVVVTVGVIVALNYESGDDASQFGPLWKRYTRVRERLAVNNSARSELAELEAFLDDVRGTKQEGYALWLLGIANYREAWTPDKATFEDREPALRKALGFLEELQEERFDDLLLAKPQWFAASNVPPIEAVYKNVKADLAFEEKNKYSEPQPDTDTVAVLRTSEGDVHLQFYKELAPQLVANFVALARAGTYNGTAFHFVRVDDSDPANPKPVAVMAGDPLSFFYNDPLKRAHLERWGNGSVGYELPPEEARFRVNHRRRIVSSTMRDNADWNNGVQFMIFTDGDPSLDRRHTPFARVAEGMAVVDAAAKRKTAGDHEPYQEYFTSRSTRGLVVEPVIIHKVVVFEKGAALEHSFPLADNEKSLATLGKAPAEPLAGEDAYGGRRLVFPRETAEPRKGLDIPYPADIDTDEANPRGDRRVTGAEPKKDADDNK